LIASQRTGVKFFGQNKYLAKVAFSPRIKAGLVGLINSLLNNILPK
jgi:hypothetical protein